MNLRIAFFLLLGVLEVSVTSCFKDPGYPSSPAITFKGLQFIKAKPGKNGLIAQDTMRLAINFIDAQGDIGVDSIYAASNPRYNMYFDADSTQYNRKTNNLWIRLMVEGRAGKFDSVPDIKDLTFKHKERTSKPYDGRTPIFSRLERQTDVQGTLTYAITDFFDAYPSVQFVRGHRFYINVKLLDRAFNESNELTSPMYVIP